MDHNEQERSRLRYMQTCDPAKYIELLESLLIDAEDIALYRGDWGLCECRLDCGEIYQSQTCAHVIDLARERRTKTQQLSTNS